MTRFLFEGRMMAKTKESGNTLESVLQIMNERCGPGTILRGTELLVDPPRLPFGVFPVDFISGGGMPIWGSTCLWGAESSGKSSLAANAVGMAGDICWRCFFPHTICSCSSSPLRMRSIYSDTEGSYDRAWGACIGADPEKYYYSLADYAEMHINIADAALRADDCGLLVFDSLASLTTAAEFEAAAEKKFIANQPALIGRSVRTLKQRLIRERKRGHPCLILFTNQFRIAVGEVHPSRKETMPGGFGMRHEFSLLLKLGKRSLKSGGSDSEGEGDGEGEKENKSKYEKFVLKDRDAAVLHSVGVYKEKVMTLARSAVFLRVKQDLPELRLSKGQVDDYSTVLLYARRQGVLQQASGGWEILGFKVKRQTDLIDYWKDNPDDYFLVKKEIISRAKANLQTFAGNGVSSVEEEEG